MTNGVNFEGISTQLIDQEVMEDLASSPTSLDGVFSRCVVESHHEASLSQVAPVYHDHILVTQFRVGKVP